MLYRSQKRFITPEEKDQALTELLALINNAQKTIRIGIYGYTLQEMTDALINAFKKNIDVQILFDHTQSCGPEEQKQLKDLEDAGIIHGKNYWIGTSSDAHAIRHYKNIMVDGIWCESGSLNYSVSAFKQQNDVLIEYDAEITAMKLKDWEEAKNWIIQNEPQYQIAPKE